MSSIPAVSAVSNPFAPGAGSTDTSTARVANKTLGQGDFLKLLAAQFQTQDPMKPMDDTSFIAQMAQFSSLEQTQTLTQQMTQLRASQDLNTANSYLGMQLTVKDPTSATAGRTITGQVTGVDASGATPQLMINGVSYPLSSVLFVAPPTAAAPAASPATTGGG